MTRFTDGLRVRVKALDHPLAGCVGTVCRVRIADGGAWVEMDTRPADAPPNTFPFPKTDGRGRHTLLYPDECEAAT